MGRKVQLNYDELRTVVKKFRNEGEDIVQLHSTMRDRVHDLHKDWAGEGADKFFKEMENDVLPALTRLSSALFYAQDVLHKIIQTIQSFDEDTARFFRIDFAQVNPLNLGAFLAGAGLGVGIGSLVGGSSAGGLSGAGGPVDSIGGTGQPEIGSQAGPDQAGVGDQPPGTDGQSPGAGAGTASGTQTAGVGSGAAGGGSYDQGSLSNPQGVAGGVGSQGGGGAGGGSLGGGSVAADHIYEGSSGAGEGGSSAQTTQGSGSGAGGAQGSSGGEGTVAAGAAGVAGSAALGVAGKSIKSRFRKKKR